MTINTIGAAPPAAPARQLSVPTGANLRGIAWWPTFWVISYHLIAAQAC
jgi:hypothetical protein